MLATYNIIPAMTIIERLKLIHCGGKQCNRLLHTINKSCRRYTFIECILETGRTHQIRVHLQTIKFPIVGDNIYGPKKMAYDYQLLHATTLAFNHPRTGNKVEVYAPLPKHFEEALENLRTTGNIKGVN